MLVYVHSHSCTVNFLSYRNDVPKKKGQKTFIIYTSIISDHHQQRDIKSHFSEKVLYWVLKRCSELQSYP